MWLDPGELDEMVEDTETAAVTPDLGAMRSAMSEQPGVEPISAPVKYRQCPHCNSMMNRRNFGTLSGVVIDECPRHGVFLDPDELQAIETFISLGGRELEKLSEEERMLRREKHAQRVLQDAQHTYAEARNMHRRAWFTFFGWF
jgi:Zn-finger nucleic acid-binding protein